MKICPKCGAEVNETAAFCPNCGTAFGDEQPARQPMYQFRVTPPTDHTAEFDPKDISDNKVIAMLPYLMGFIGIVIALLGASTSKYAGFHVRQELKIMVCGILLLVCCIVPFLGWLVAGIGAVILFIAKIVCFIDVCRGLAKEPLLVNHLGFLK